MDQSYSRDTSDHELAIDLARDGRAGSTGEQAYRRIRTDIVFGRLQPGQRLPLQRLRSEYGVSVSTLREILCSLEPDGLVTAEGQRGFQVAPCSANEFRELATLRLLLEHHALEQSFHAGDVEWEARVVAAHHKLVRLEKLLLAGDNSQTEQWKRYDWEFHRSLLSACSSQALRKLHANIYDRYLRYQMVFVIFRGQVAADEHKSLLECALRRDVAAAQQTLSTHVEGCVEYAVRNSLIS